MPTFDKVGGKIIRTNLSANEREAMNRTIKSEIVRLSELYDKEVDAVILLTLHTEFGFGKDRLKKFFYKVVEDQIALRRRYELDDEGTVYVAMQKLRYIGVDIDEWWNDSRKLLREG